MITEDTVFILGAGASFPYGYPTGQGLRIQLCKEFPIQFSRIVELSTRGFLTMILWNTLKIISM